MECAESAPVCHISDERFFLFLFGKSRSTTHERADIVILLLLKEKRKRDSGLSKVVPSPPVGVHLISRYTAFNIEQKWNYGIWFKCSKLML